MAQGVWEGGEVSKKGIEKAAAVLSEIQQARIELLGGDKQDILLGQMFHDATEAVKDRFTKITLGRWPHMSRPSRISIDGSPTITSK